MVSTKPVRHYSPLETAAAAILAIAAVAYGFYRLRYGFSIGDEGHSLSVPLRYGLGDVPFRDEVLNPLRWFDIMMWPVMRWLPREGGVLFLRRATFIFHLLCCFAFVWPFRKKLSPLLSASVFAASVYSNIYNYWTPTYHSASADFWMLALGLWAMGMAAKSGGRASLLGVLAGFAGFAASSCIVPGAALLAVPAAAAIYAFIKKGRTSPEFISSASFACVATLLLARAALALYQSGLVHYLLEDISFMRAAQTDVNNNYGFGLPRLAHILGILRTSMPFAIIHGAYWLAVAGIAIRAAKARRGVGIFARAALLSILTAAYAAFIINYVITNIKSLDVINCIEGFCLFSMLFHPAANLWLKRANKAVEWPPYMTWLYAFGLIWHLLLAAISGSALVVSALITMPVQIAVAALTASVLISASKPADENAAPASCSVPAAALPCIALIALLVTASLSSGGSEKWVWRLDAQFSNEKLKGIRASSAQVNEYERLLAFLAPRVHEGDFLLVFYENPLLHYLTETRAALPTGFPNRLWSQDTRTLFVKRMIERRRAPRYVVNYRTFSRDSISEFVTRNYRPIYKEYPFMVLELKTPPEKVVF